MAAVPPFTIDAPKYDQSTYYGRWRQFVELVSPSALFLTKEQIQSATTTLEKYRNGDIAPGQMRDEELWHARRVYESAVHPQTGEMLPLYFRLSAFVPVNIPICAGMILAPPTLGNTIFWQWINQSYNAGFNYANRNASSEQDNSTIFKSYATASFVSCVTAVGLGRIVETAKSLSPGVRSALRKTVPFVAVASAGAFNAVSMRFNEFTDGIDIIDDDGEVRGRSVAAGRQSLTQVALTRVALPMPILLLPPYLYEGLKKAKLMPKAKYPRLATELTVLTLCLWGALPAAVALFPQNGTIAAADVEEEFRNLTDKQGNRIEKFTYNKGI
uniref:Sidoreflexin n=1 Tax=Globisporangium ultimum (strain ATCC 200006 / CBS 805.95 / DAOM BR144) TaxID=431595 RepID=K3WGK8_GLOUD